VYPFGAERLDLGKDGHEKARAERVCAAPFGVSYGARTCGVTGRVRFPERMDRVLVIRFVRVRRTR
jgi:hypothetical protein